MSERGRLAFVALPSVCVVGALFAFVPPIPQPQWYHDFADRLRRRQPVEEMPHER